MLDGVLVVLDVVDVVTVLDVVLVVVVLVLVLLVVSFGVHGGVITLSTGFPHWQVTLVPFL